MNITAATHFEQWHEGPEPDGIDLLVTGPDDCAVTLDHGQPVVRIRLQPHHAEELISRLRAGIAVYAQAERAYDLRRARELVQQNGEAA